MSEDTSSSRTGFFMASAAYLLWGLLPLYMKAIDHVPPAEIVAHRILWSVPVAAVVLMFLGRTRDFFSSLTNPRLLGMMALTASIITLNWGVYVWAVVNNIASEASLGYYINPLLSITLAFVLLREKLQPLQWAAVGLACLAVALLTVLGGTFPGLALIMAFSFAIYGYLRKTVPIGPTQGFLLEVVMLAPFALAYVFWLSMQGESHLIPGTADFWWLVGCGPVTAIPLILFAFGAKALRLATIGIMQYIAPTLIFLCAVFVFDEEVTGWKYVAFALIWTALALYSVSLLRRETSHEGRPR